MWDKVQGALPNDSFAQEIGGYASALGKDLVTHVGIPIVGMSRNSYHQIADSLSDDFSIPKLWFQDLLHVNGVEVLGASVATIAVALRWNKAQTEEFSKLVGSLGLSAVASANPALAVVSVAILSKAFIKARHQDNYLKIVDGLAKGGVGTGALLATSALIAGPVWVGMLTGLCVAGVVSRTTSNIYANDIRLFLEQAMRANLLSEQDPVDPPTSRSP